eukprot:TRINITY_DN3770_c0_g1_i1.p1 TRINITY_DN3770_c0_g1~~TRINITY_DN3770_c0_g1_i1.p1  ORF type:complete len:358 (+),score=7.69 TRINITY_DN3770_c0_g1_i1:150-1223(+)
MTSHVQTPVRVIGSTTGGSAFQHWAGSDGRVVERILVYSGPSQIKAITFWFTNTASITVGVPSPNTGSRQYDFQPGERITRLSLWGNGAGTRAGWIRFETTLTPQNGRIFDFGMSSWGKKEEFPVDVGSGIFIGLMGRANVDVDSIGFIFVKPLASARVVDVRYPTLDMDVQAGIRPVTLEGFRNTNNNTNGQPLNWTFEGSRTVTESSSWSNTTSFAYHVGWSVEGSVPFLASAGASGGWELSVSVTHEHTSSTERSLAWSNAGTLDPGQTVSLEAVTRVGNLNIDYEAAFEVVLRDGSRFRYPFKDTYFGTAYAGVEVVTSGTRRAGDQPAEEDVSEEVQDIFEPLPGATEQTKC